MEFGATAIVMTNRGGTIKFVRDAESDEEMSVGIGTTASINTTGIVTATRFFAGLTEVINSSGEFVGKSFAANVDGGLPNSVYGGIPVIDGGVYNGTNNTTKKRSLLVNGRH